VTIKDTEIFSLIEKEKLRQSEGLELIPSENYVSEAVLEALGSILTNKYSEGFPGKRYYGGNQYIDEIETLANERIKKIFGFEYVTVQPHSGSPANFAIYLAICEPGDTFMGLNLTDGGHLTHGWKMSATSMFYKSVPYHVKADGRIDMEEVERLAKEFKPKFIWSGATAYPFIIDFKRFGEIADEVGAYHVADIAHIAGLIAAGEHPSPVEHAHLVTSTTHKTFRGPRGGFIGITKKGLEKDPELISKIEKAIIPGFQGGPHNHQTAAIGVAAGEVLSPEFKEYGSQIVKNAKVLAETLQKGGIRLIGNGTENHLLLIDLTPITGPGGGVFGSEALEAAGMTANKNTIPSEPCSPFFPSGIRLGTPALTTRGMKEDEMKKVGEWIVRALSEIKLYNLPEKKEERKEYIAKAKKEIFANHKLIEIKKEIKTFCANYPVPGID